MAASNGLHQMSLLAWKNLKLSLRKPVGTLLLFLIPLLFVALMVGLRFTTEVMDITGTTKYPAFPIDTKFIPRKDYDYTTVFYSPNTTLVRDIMESVNQKMGYLKPAKSFSSEAALLDYFSLNPQNVFGGVVFNGMNSATDIPKSVSYKIRPNSEKENWRTGFKFPFTRNLEPRNKNDKFSANPSYVQTGFISLQWAIDSTLIEMANNLSAPLNDDFAVFLRRVPYPPYVSDPYVRVIQSQLPLIIILSFIYLATQITKSIVYEREKRLVEAMKMMGLQSWTYWIMWYIHYLFYFLVVMAISAGLYCADFGSQLPVIPKSSGWLIFIFLLIYGMSTISFCFMLSTIFNKASSAASGAGVIFFLSYLPNLFVSPLYETLSRGGKLGLSLISNVGMSIGVRIIGYHEGTGEGALWTNFDKPAIIDDNVSLLDIIIMLIVDIFLYLVILWYFDTVRPGEFGVPRPWYFPFTKSYWCGGAAGATDEGDKVDSVRNKDTFENDPVGLKNGIVIKNLRKVYGKGDESKVAVAGTSLKMFEGQITALLGHNGAGKTTTMSMLTGFIPPTSGTAIINGHSIATDLTAVRSSLGLCPQHDILFDLLTVREHICFFAQNELHLFRQLKGVKIKDVKDEVDSMVEVLGLQAKQNARSSTLSGGQKRKLSVGIALCADSKVIILDEPSSGLDPSARRQLWDILQKHQKGRTILLSTHFMDEADILGDRIAIMAEGVVKCCGSSLYLKNKYGAGYYLTIVKSPKCDVSRLTAAITSRVPAATVSRQVAAELTYSLPHDEAPKFEELFNAIERDKDALGVASFGVSETTMEDVFLRVGAFANDFPEKKFVSENNLDVAIQNGDGGKNMNIIQFNEDLRKNTGFRLKLQQFYGMFIKKMIHSKRNRLVTIVQLVLPVFFTVLALIADKVSRDVANNRPVPFSLEGYGSNFVPVSAGINPDPLLTSLEGTYATLFKSTQTDVITGPANQTDEFALEYFVNKGNERDNSYFATHYLMGAEFKSSANSSSLVSYFSGEPYHLPAISLSYLSNALFKVYTGTSYWISASNHPLPKSASNVAGDTRSMFRGFSVAFNILIGIIFMVSSFVIFMIKEKNVRAKHIQVSSGASTTIFWLANFAWDFINYMIPCLILLVILAAFQIEAYVYEHRLGIVFLLLVLFGWSLIPFIYIVHFPFKTAASGMAAISILNIVWGMATLLSVVILNIEGLGTKNIAEILEWVFIPLSPHFCFSKGIMDMYTNYFLNDICYESKLMCDKTPNPCCKDTGNCGIGAECIKFEEDYLSLNMPGVGRYLISMALQGFLFMAITLLIDMGILGKVFRPICSGMRTNAVGENYSPRNTADDSDVVDEQNRIRSNLAQLKAENTLVVDKMSKTFRGFKAVDKLSLAVPTGECFGLLGVNGAGKTTSFKMLTGDLTMTQGQAYLNGSKISSDSNRHGGEVGYCAQFDALIDQMTGREMLYLFARIRGIRSSQIPRVVDGLLKAFLLMEHAEKQTAKYSGGNKRKLSTALSLIGDPSIIFMDEPTTGMDPAARRQLWTVLSQIRASGRTIIFTSHSMEECDALCTRIAIMVNGQFRCLGSSQHLKSKFGEGYTLSARIGCLPGAATPDVGPIKTYIETTFPSHRCIHADQGYVNYQLTDPSVSLGAVFGVMERARGVYNIEDYSVSQTTLDQVFINFARAQVELNRGGKRGCWARCTGGN